MAIWSNLPTELVLSIVEYAVDAQPTSATSWAVSLLPLSHTLHRALVPAIYRSVHLTSKNIALISIQMYSGNLYFTRYTRRLYIHADLSQTPWSIYRLSVFSRITHFSGPQSAFRVLRDECGAPMLTRAYLELMHVAAVLRNDSLAGITHLCVQYVPPVDSILSPILPSSLTHIILAPLAMIDIESFRHDIVLFLTASRLQRLVVRLGNTINLAIGVIPFRVTAPILLRKWALELREPRLFLDTSLQTYNVEDDLQWVAGDPLFIET